MERAKTAKIRDIMNTWTGEELPTSFQLTAEDADGVTIVIATAAQTSYVLKNRYGDMLYSGYPQFDTIESLAQEFLVDWMYEFSIYAAMVQHWYDALTAEYNPISNYDRTEESKEWIGEKTNERTYDDTLTIENGVKTIDYDTATYESAVKNRETITETQKIGDDHTHSGTVTDTETQTKDNASQKESHVSGNIGVTTSQQMIESELSLRQFNILIDFITMFLRNHAHSVGGVDYDS